MEYKKPSEKEIDNMRELIIRLDKQKRAEFKQVSNWDVDDYYERKLKQFDTE